MAGLKFDIWDKFQKSQSLFTRECFESVHCIQLVKYNGILTSEILIYSQTKLENETRLLDTGFAYNANKTAK